MVKLWGVYINITQVVTGATDAHRYHPAMMWHATTLCAVHMGWLQRRLLICLLLVHGLRMHRSRMHCLPARWLLLHAVLAAHGLASAR